MNSSAETMTTRCFDGLELSLALKATDEVGDTADIFGSGLVAVEVDAEIFFHLATQFSHLDSPYR